MYHILLFSYNKVNQRKNVFKKIITKGKHIYSIEKNPHVNGLAQFKPVLFKGRLCFWDPSAP